LSSAQPNFFIVGAPKAGTTSLYHYLDQHPEIYMSPVKEPNYFASEVRLESFAEAHQDGVRRSMRETQEYLAGPMSEKRSGAMGLDWDGYLKLFRNANGETAIGEASVCYLWSESAGRNIAERIPEARILMILRHPVERAFSQYVQLACAGYTRDTFLDACKKSIARRGGKFQALSPLLEMGLYADQVKRYLDLFPRGNIQIFFYEDYQRDAKAMFADTLRFLGVDASFEPDMSQRFRARGVRRAMDDRDRSYLTSFYRDDVRKLAGLLNRDLSHWEH
jgi:sulfotransferase family protein